MSEQNAEYVVVSREVLATFLEATDSQCRYSTRAWQARKALALALDQWPCTVHNDGSTCTNP